MKSETTKQNCTYLSLFPKVGLFTSMAIIVIISGRWHVQRFYRQKIEIIVTTPVRRSLEKSVLFVDGSFESRKCPLSIDIASRPSDPLLLRPGLLRDRASGTKATSRHITFRLDTQTSILNFISS